MPAGAVTGAGSPGDRPESARRERSSRLVFFAPFPPQAHAAILSFGTVADRWGNIMRRVLIALGAILAADRDLSGAAGPALTGLAPAPPFGYTPRLHGGCGRGEALLGL